MFLDICNCIPTMLCRQHHDKLYSSCDTDCFSCLLFMNSSQPRLLSTFKNLEQLSRAIQMGKVCGKNKCSTKSLIHLDKSCSKEKKRKGEFFVCLFVSLFFGVCVNLKERKLKLSGLGLGKLRLFGPFFRQGTLCTREDFVKYCVFYVYFISEMSSIAVGSHNCHTHPVSLHNKS